MLFDFDYSFPFHNMSKTISSPLIVLSLPKECFCHLQKKSTYKNTYLIFVQSNGSGHFTQMMQIIEILKPIYECIGIIASYEKANVTKYAHRE